MKWLQEQPLRRELPRALGKYFARESGLTDAQMRHLNPIKYLWESRIGQRVSVSLHRQHAMGSVSISTL
jgi:hypothetical protein